MILTSSFDNWKSDQYMAIAIDEYDSLGNMYRGKIYYDLVSNDDIRDRKIQNINTIEQYNRNKRYIREYYMKVLRNLDPEKVYRELGFSVILSNGDNMELSNRHIVAAWLELIFDIKVQEAKIENNRIKYIDSPKYIKDYLEEVMIKNTKMKGFNTIRGLYLSTQADKLEKMSESKSREEGIIHNEYRQIINSLREEANYIEKKYKREHNPKTKQKVKTLSVI